MIKKNNLNQLIRESLELCNGRQKSLSDGDYKSANKIVKKLERLYLAILEYEDDGINKLADLLIYDSPYVRIWAASGLLPYKPHEALKIIHSIKESDEPFASGFAEMILDLWENGQLKFPSSVNKKSPYDQ